jgi:hypothetical protein
LTLFCLQTLKELLESKKVDYDFSFYTLPINAEVPVTVLSEGKSLLCDSLDVIVPFNPSSPLGTPPPPLFEKKQL